MPDKETTEPPQGDQEPASGDNAEVEKFWARLDERVDAGIERALKKYRSQAPVGNSRTGRATLPGILADLVFGPPKGD